MQPRIYGTGVCHLRRTTPAAACYPARAWCVAS